MSDKYSGMKFRDVAPIVARGKTCIATGCTKGRHGITRYCKQHYDHCKRNGHPSQLAIRAKQYREELADVTDLLEKNQGHTGIITALDHFKRWQEDATAGKKVPAKVSVLKSIERGVTAQVMLCEAAALFRFSETHPRDIKDKSALTFQMGRAILRLGSMKERRKGRLTGTVYYRQPSVTQIREAGLYVMEPLSGLLLNISHTLDHRNEAADRKKAEQWQPFNI